MGRPKLTLPLGDRAVIEHVVAALTAGGADHVLVVAGPHDPRLAGLAAGAGADVLPLPEPTADMRETVTHGLRRLAERFRPRQTDAWLLAPADHPALTEDAVRPVCEAGRRHPNAIVVPVCGGRRGHPVLLPWPLAAAVEALPPGQGIDALVRANADNMVEVPVSFPGVLDDLDTPDDYRRLSRGE
jgi:molybdenum cofactor cytidylyltransferase